MTRETKIGLLVGLAFIIVIGILLSDQLMRSTEPPAAPLGQVADTVRRGTTTPASQHRPAAPVTSAADVSPDNMVPIREELTRRPPPVTFVEIRPGGETGGTVVVNGGNLGQGGIPNQTQGQYYRPAGTNGQQDAPIRTQTPGPANGGGRTIADVAAGYGEVLVGPDGQPVRATQPLGARTDQQGGVIGALGTQVQPRWTPPANHDAATGGVKQYKVEPGDSLSKIALKTMGSASKANRDAIVKANPSLAADPNKVIIGVTYNIPAPVTTPATAGQPATPQPIIERVVQPQPAPTPRTAAEYFYTVKEGDSLWKIAKDQCGDPTMVAAIKELNKDTLKGGETVVLNMKLKLPAKPIASAQ